MNLLVLQFNNYFNRTIKKLDTVNDYNNYVNELVPNYNFNPNDAITTDIILNWNNVWSPDYVVVFDEYNNIQSRWFIIESVRLRNKQFKCSLKRDSVADNLNQILTAPCFIEKATPKTTSDICIFNNEGNAYNQIKKDEVLLKDEVGTGWIVGYMASNTPQTQVTASNLAYQAEVYATWDNCPYYEYRTGQTPYKYVKNKRMTIAVQGIRVNPPIISVDVNGSYNLSPTISWSSYFLDNFDTEQKEEIAIKLSNFVNSNSSLLWDAFFNNETGYKKADNLSNKDGKLIYITSENKYYYVRVNKQNLNYTLYSGTNTSSAGLAKDINDIMQDFEYNGKKMVVTTQPGYRSLEETYLECTVMSTSFDEVTLSGYNLTIPSGANLLSDAPYKMFAIPYGNRITLSYVHVGSSTHSLYSLTKEEALNIAMATATALGTNLYDLQLLPYCPLRDTLSQISSETINCSTYVENQDTAIIYKTVAGEQVDTSVVFFPKISKFTFDISISSNPPSDVVDFKIEDETGFHRLCSPNMASSFEFKNTRLGGLTKFNVDCTYKPYSPYIKLNPNFSGLYGQDFNDYRGMICQGDFSLPVVNSQWQNYQINNKNYLNAFNREIDSLELTHSYDMLGKKWGVAAGAISGITGGAITGATTTHGGIGAGIGAGLGGIMSLAGGIADLNVAEKLYQEQLDLTKDRFRFNIQNIQAMPNTLAKTSAFDNNNKIYPVLEYYSCTDQEKDNLRQKLEYEGFTINKLTDINSYKNNSKVTYIRGTIVLIDDFKGDSHELLDIKKEIKQGVRL